MKIKIVWECTQCKKENEEDDFDMVYCGGAFHNMYIPLKCTTCGNVDKIKRSDK